MRQRARPDGRRHRKLSAGRCDMACLFNENKVQGLNDERIQAGERID